MDFCLDWRCLFCIRFFRALKYIPQEIHGEGRPNNW